LAPGSAVISFQAENVLEVVADLGRVVPRVACPPCEWLFQRPHVADFERRSGIHLGRAAEPIQAEQAAIERVHQFHIGPNDLFKQCSVGRLAFEADLIVER